MIRFIPLDADIDEVNQLYDVEYQMELYPKEINYVMSRNITMGDYYF